MDDFCAYQRLQRAAHSIKDQRHNRTPAEIALVDAEAQTSGQASTYLEMERARKRESALVQEVASLRKSLLEIVRLYNAYEIPHEYMAEEALRTLRTVKSNV